MVNDDDPGWVDLGHDTHYRRVADAAGNWIGIIERHRCSGGDFSAGAVRFDTDAARRVDVFGPYWHVESAAPLTLQPSIACSRCGHHGWIRSGRWEPA